jgi:hypothetical protein
MCFLVPVLVFVSSAYYVTQFPHHVLLWAERYDTSQGTCPGALNGNLPEGRDVWVNKMNEISHEEVESARIHW